MHIPENYLSPVTCGVMTAAMVPVWARAVNKVNKEIPKEKIPLLGVGAAFSFLGMMFNIPIPGGSTGHAVGGTLIALMVGPDAACIAVTIALLIQAVLFGDGGILAFGANCFNMAFVLPYLGYWIYTILAGKDSSKENVLNRRKLLGALLGSYVGINAAAFLAAIEFGIQPYFFKDANGLAMYCPYGLDVSIPSMMLGHITIWGLTEAIFTVAIFSYVCKVSPATIYSQNKDKENRKLIYALISGLILLVPLGLLAQGTAWGEWGADEISEVVTKGTTLGYTPEGLLNGFELNTLVPDYAIAGMNDVVAYYLSAIVGVLLVLILFKLLAGLKKSKVSF